jgi:hypothetical protein
VSLAFHEAIHNRRKKIKEKKKKKKRRKKKGEIKPEMKDVKPS